MGHLALVFHTGPCSCWAHSLLLLLAPQPPTNLHPQKSKQLPTTRPHTYQCDSAAVFIWRKHIWLHLHNFHLRCPAARAIWQLWIRTNQRWFHTVGKILRSWVLKSPELIPRETLDLCSKHTLGGAPWQSPAQRLHLRVKSPWATTLQISLTML